MGSRKEKIMGVGEQGTKHANVKFNFDIVKQTVLNSIKMCRED